MATISLKQNVHGLKQRERILLQAIGKKQEQNEKLKKELESQKEQVMKLEKQILAESTKDVNLAEEFKDDNMIE